MAIGQFIKSFMGCPIRQYDPDEGLVEPAKYAWRLGPNYDSYDSTFEAQLGALLADPRLSELEVLVIGPWSEEMFDEDGASVAEALTSEAPRLTSLKGLFYGDITYEFCEISWIQQADLGRLVSGLPALEEVVIRGGEGLRLSNLQSETLKSLTVQAGGMSGAVVRDIVTAHLPNLRTLELWLGTDNYGGSSTVEDLQPLLSGKAFPSLQTLGLKNCDYANAIAEALATAPVTELVSHLDLSMGTLTDEGAQHVLDCPAMVGLELLDLSENYVSEAMGAKLRAVFGDRVNVWTEKEADGDWTYVSCGE